jgi:hypothetical protein
MSHLTATASTPEPSSHYYIDDSSLLVLGKYECSPDSVCWIGSSAVWRLS